ncbi:hypothetical protein E2C01_020979 [Portunus trituberculatus]|uniref:Uncharacterized protein n=1 Tax=Portunus trituberculatus TaxID=210409 RepID=A0A5B7E369_PORTR|nr:hypothetical protein [Portunus trituberculatus]
MSASMKFYSPTPKLLTLYIHPCMKYSSHVWGDSTYTVLLDRVESKAFRLISSPPVFSLFLTTGMLHLLLSSTAIFTAILILLKA